MASGLTQALIQGGVLQRFKKGNEKADGYWLIGFSNRIYVYFVIF